MVVFQGNNQLEGAADSEAGNRNVQDLSLRYDGISTFVREVEVFHATFGRLVPHLVTHNQAIYKDLLGKRVKGKFHLGKSIQSLTINDFDSMKCRLSRSLTGTEKYGPPIALEMGTRTLHIVVYRPLIEAARPMSIRSHPHLVFQIACPGIKPGKSTECMGQRFQARPEIPQIDCSDDKSGIGTDSSQQAEIGKLEIICNRLPIDPLTSFSLECVEEGRGFEISGRCRRLAVDDAFGIMQIGNS